jgi:3',5'-cyclic AMP phosphodiesterase CpdA
MTDSPIRPRGTLLAAAALLAIVLAGNACSSTPTAGPPVPEAPRPSASAPAGAGTPAPPARSAPGPGTVTLPLKQGSLKFAVVGDTGTAARIQFDVGKQMLAWHDRVPFELVLMTGDNIYGADTAADMRRKFEEPYAGLLAKGVKFYASLGNHDSPNQRFYKLYNMNGERFYTFRPKMGVRLFALDSNYVDSKQLAWLEKELAASGSEWKICFFHHPLYSSGKNHGPAVATREVLEPVFVRHGVSVVLTGHEHFYERIKPQKGILHFISGGGGKLRPGDIRKDPQTAKGFDTDLHFMLMEIDGDDLYYQAVSRGGVTVDSGSFRRVGAAAQGAPDAR